MYEGYCDSYPPILQNIVKLYSSTMKKVAINFTMLKCSIVVKVRSLRAHAHPVLTVGNTVLLAHAEEKDILGKCMHLPLGLAAPAQQSQYPPWSPATITDSHTEHQIRITINFITLA